MREIQAGIEEIRPGRKLFVRQWILDGDDESPRMSRMSSTTKMPILHAAAAAAATADVDLQLVLVHGMCATELQYHEMLHAIEKEMMMICKSDNNKTKKQRIHCIMYDMVGCGQSPVTPDWDAYRKTEHMQDLQANMRRGRDVLPRNKKTSISTILVSHSYGPSIVLSWLASLQRQQQQQQPQDQELAASNHDDGDYNIQGLVFLSTSLRDDNLPHPDGGAWPFRYLPMSVLHCLNATMTRDFCHRAVHGKHSTLKRAMLEAGPRNDMVMVQAFHRQAIWATRDDLQTALQVLTRQFSNSSSSTSSSSLARLLVGTRAQYAAWSFMVLMMALLTFNKVKSW
jgi:pimeloyl-ACP methyl ester carboxylesterase